MMAAHTIRLAGPWEFTPAGTDEPIRVRLPFVLPELTASGQLTRRFHRPGGLTDTTAVRIEIAVDGWLRELGFNGTRIEPIEQRRDEIESCRLFSFDVRPLLQPFNALTIDVSHDSCRPESVLSAAVAIEEQ